MKRRVQFFALMGIFWISFFVLSRLLFLVYHGRLTADLSVREICTVMALGLRMDAAMTGYWLLATGLLLSVPRISPARLSIVHSVLICILIAISAAIVTVDLELYSHWGFRMNTTPLFYMSTEAAGSVNATRLALLIVLFILLLAISFFLFFTFLSKKMAGLPPAGVPVSSGMLLITGLLFIPIRSSFSVAPLNTGAVYFHKTKAFPNHAGINVVWNFFNSLSAKDNLKYPTNFFHGDARATLRQMERSTSPKFVLTTRRPNIILIILESFTSNIVEPLGGMPGVTPQLNSLMREGILFDHFYASGDRTDKGLVAVLSAFPAQPKTSIIRFPQKTQHLPFLSRTLQTTGYHTSFVYGGDVAFANMRSYLTTAGFTHITDVADFSSPGHTSKWGIADQYVFDRMLQECDTAQQNFFKVMLSLSSHEPFEVPMAPVIPGAGERALFLNACFYADRSFGNFIAAAKKKSWWKNTLIIVTADHGHRFPNEAELKEKERFKIPMLWLGGALAVRDTVIHTIGGQTDIANTIFSQTGSSHRGFDFSKNLLAPDTRPFAVYVFQNGFGYVDDAGDDVYDFDSQSYSRQQGDEQARTSAHAYMQVLFDDYNRR